ncbi:Ig-like domain-containing protein [Actinoallomurus bryophytorum]|uniref:Ig-like domain-containing protein n=1 Tax=Actinoallomurus bryophytorum TaxID=1490222 RepID=UPI003CCC5078
MDSDTITRPSCAKSATGTTTTLTSSANSVPVGQPVSFGATVKATTGTAVPTGLVVFADGRKVILGAVALDGAGHAVLTTSALSPGIHRIRAVYLGTTDFVGSTSPRLAEYVLPG